MLKIRDIQAFPTSFALPEGKRVALGVGTTVKRDAVVVKVTTEDGVVGWGESHHARAHTAIAKLIETTLRGLIIGQEATDCVGIWNRVYRYQLGSHGAGAATAMAMSGIDMALWDIRAKAAGWPLYRLLGGGARGVTAYAGGIALGYQPPEALAEEAMAMLESGYRALKLRVGDSPERDIARMEAVRQTVPDGTVLMADANTACSLDHARTLIPAMDRLGFAWLEEPFPAHDHRLYAIARGYGHVPLAAGENHYTRFEFHRVIEDGTITVLQPDLSKCGGVTEAMRIAHLASAWKLPIHPHSSLTGINQAAAIHLLCAIDNGGYFEADVSSGNLYRDKLCSTPWILGTHGQVWPNEAPGIGVEVDESVLRAHPPIEGPSYV